MIQNNLSSGSGVKKVNNIKKMWRSIEDKQEGKPSTSLESIKNHPLVGREVFVEFDRQGEYLCTIIFNSEKQCLFASSDIVLGRCINKEEADELWKGLLREEEKCSRRKIIRDGTSKKEILQKLDGRMVFVNFDNSSKPSLCFIKYDRRNNEFLAIDRKSDRLIRFDWGKAKQLIKYNETSNIFWVKDGEEIGIGMAGNGEL